MKSPLFRIARSGASAAAATATEITARLVQPPSPLVRIGTIALVLFIGYQVWDYVAPRKPPLAPALHDITARVMPIIVQDLRAEKGTPRSVALLHLAGDNSGHLTTELRESISMNNVLDLRDKALTEKARDALRMRQPDYGDIGSAVARGESLGADAVLFGRLHLFDSDEAGDARIDLELQLADVKQKTVILSRRYREQLGSGVLGTNALAAGLGRIGVVQRFLAWAVIVLLLPVFTITFIRAMVRRESNAANAFVLGIYTLVGTALAYLLLGVNFSSLTSSALFLVIFVAVLIYNMSVMTFALRLET